MRTRKKSKPTIDTDVLRRAIHAAIEKTNDADMAADVAAYLYQGAIDCQEIGEPASDISLAIYAKIFREAIELRKRQQAASSA